MSAVTSTTRARVLLGSAVAVLAGILALLIWLFVRLIAPQPSLETPASELVWVRSIYGYGPSDAEQLLGPSSVAVGPEGDIYVTDPVRSRVLVFAPDGALLRIVASPEPGYSAGQFVRPESIAVDRVSGELYIADSWARKIIVYDRQGVYQREWSAGGQARGVAVSGERVFVLGEGTVAVFNTHGVRQTQFGRRGIGEGEIDAYQGILADDERIYIADSYNRRVQAFTHDGELVWAHPSQVSTRTPVSAEDTIPTSAQVTAPVSAQETGQGGLGEWDLPQDLVFDGAGRIVVVDAFRFELVVVDPEDGKMLAAYGQFGEADGRFFYPTSIDYDRERDWFVVADTQNNRVQIVRLPGTQGGVLAPLRRAADSPWRFVAIPLVLFFLATVIAVRDALRARRAAAGVEA